MHTSAKDVRQEQLKQYEISAAEYEVRALLATDRSRRREYELLAARYRHLAARFREALAIHGAALARLTLH